MLNIFIMLQVVFDSRREKKVCNNETLAERERTFALWLEASFQLLRARPEVFYVPLNARAKLFMYLVLSS
jgi:hypothetical protein